MSTSPEPLIDFTTGGGGGDTASIGSGDSFTSNGTGSRRRPPPPPKPPLVRANSDMKPLPPLPPPASKKPQLFNKPLPPPKIRASVTRTLSTPPSVHRPIVTQRNNNDISPSPSPPLPSRNNASPPTRPLPSPPTRPLPKPPTQSLPPAPPPRQLPPTKPQRNSVHLDHTSRHDDSMSSPNLIKNSISNGEFPKNAPGGASMDSPPTHTNEVKEGTLIDFNSPPSSPVKSLLQQQTSQSSLRRAQPVCLPKPVSRDLEYEEREHPKNAFKKLAALREKGELCDCILMVGDTEIKAHRIVLASCSSYFESMFIGEFAEPEGIPVVIEEVDELALNTLINFAYTSRITLSHGNVYTLFEAADILEFHGVKNSCFKFFRSQMNKTNCIRTWLFAESHNCTELLDASLKYIEVNFLNIIRGREFMAIEPETVSRLLSLENIAITCEEQVYEAAIGWINYDISSRRVHAFEVLQNVRFPSINRDYLVHITENEAIVYDDADCLQLIITALESHMSNVRGTLMRKMNKENNKLLPRAAAMAVEEVELNKANSSLGIGVMGGSDRPQHVFRQGDKPGIFIRDVMPGGAAANSNKIRTGDRILSINGTDVSNSTHEEAIKLLVTSPDPLVLLIRHEPPPEGLKEITLVTKPGEGFGFSIMGGVNGYPSNPFDETDEGIFVSEVVPGGAAARDGRLVIGTRVLQINSVSLLGKTHDECLKVIQGILDRMSLLVCEGYNPSRVTPDTASIDS